jgi:hypothetical protein
MMITHNTHHESNNADLILMQVAEEYNRNSPLECDARYDAEKNEIKVFCEEREVGTILVREGRIEVAVPFDMFDLNEELCGILYAQGFALIDDRGAWIYTLAIAS